MKKKASRPDQFLIVAGA